MPVVAEAAPTHAPKVAPPVAPPVAPVAAPAPAVPPPERSEPKLAVFTTDAKPEPKAAKAEAKPEAKSEAKPAKADADAKADAKPKEARPDREAKDKDKDSPAAARAKAQANAAANSRWAGRFKTLSLPDVSTSLLKLSPEFIAAIADVTPQQRRSRIPYVIVLGLFFIVAVLAFDPPTRTFLIELISGPTQVEPSATDPATSAVPAVPDPGVEVDTSKVTRPDSKKKKP